MSKASVTPVQYNNDENKLSLHLKYLYAVQQLIVSEGITETILSEILNQLLKSLDYCAVQLYQLSTSNDLWLYLEFGLGTKPVTQNTDIFSIDEINIIGDALRTESTIYLPNIHEGPYSYYGQDQSDVNVKSEVAVPLKHKSNFLGVLRTQSQEFDAFSQADIDFLNIVAGLLASTINSNRTIQKLENDLQEAKILYNLHPDDLDRQKQAASTTAEPGYAYDKHTIITSDSLSLAAQSAISNQQTGVATIQENDHRELVAPIQLYGETIGILGIEDSVTGEQWTTDDISLLEEVSSQVGLAIENSRLLLQTQERTKELSILFEATRQLTETIDLDQIYQILASQIINFLKADRCSALLLNKARTHFEATVQKVRADERVISRDTAHIEAIEDYPSLQQMLKHPALTIQHLNDPDLEPASAHYMRQESGNIYTLTRFPLVVRNNLVGVLMVEYLGQPHNYSRNELQLAQAIISQVTVAIENAQSFQQTQAALADTQKYYEISRTLVECTSMDDIYNVVIENVKAYGTDRVSISLLDKSQAGEIESVTIVATWDRDQNRIIPVGTRFSMDNFSLVQAFAQPPFHPLISHDLRQTEGQDERMDEGFRTFALENLGAVTVFSAPMFLGTEYKGVISIYTRKPHIYSEQEVRVYQTLADQAIIAIENHRLLEATTRERDRASLLYELGQTLSSTTIVDDVNKTILDFADRIGVSEIEIYITDGADFVSVASTIPERQSQGNKDALSDETSSLALPQRQQVIKTITKEGAEQWPLNGLTGLSKMQTFASIPFYSQRSTLQGRLTFFHTAADAFTDDHITTFSSMAIQMAAALENVWLLRQTNIVLSETELLYKVTTGFNQVQTSHDLLKVMVDNFAEASIDAVSIGLISSLNHDNLPKQVEIVSHWSKQAEDITVSGLKFGPEQPGFLQLLRSDAAHEIHYNDLDSASQATIDSNFDSVRTILSIPLTMGRTWLGLLFIASKTENFVFKASTVNQIFTLAGQAAVIIKNLQLVEETQQTLYNAEILSNLGQQLLTADRADTIYNSALSAISSTEPDRGVAIFIYDQLEGNIDLELVGLWDNPRQQWPAISPGMRLSTEDLGLVPLLKTGQTVVSNRATKDERFSPALKKLFMMMQTTILVAVPLWLDQEVSGFILITNQSDNPFSPDTIRLYEDIAREISGALENRRLFEEAQNRAWQLQIAAEVSQAATAYLDLDTLLFQSVDLIKERFDFYHVSIFLADEYQRYAVVQASTGEIGQKMLTLNHKLEVGGESIVGTATGTAKPFIALDIGKDAFHFDDPFVPETRSQMALPLIAQGRVIGALDVHSTKRAAFSDSDIVILQSMANQLANAIEAARSFQGSRDALEEVRRVHERYLVEQWNDYLRQQQATTSYRLTDQGLIANSAGDYRLLHPEIDKVLKEKQTIIVPALNGGNAEGKNGDTYTYQDDVSTLIAPLTLNGQAVLGAVDFEISAKDIETIADEDTLRIIEAVTNQAAQAIEAARLFEQTQISREEAEALYQVGRILVAAENEQEIFDTVLVKMLDTLGLDQGGVLFFDNDRKFGKLYALFENGNPVDNPDLRFPIEDNLSYQKLIKTKRPVAIGDIATDPLVATVREMNVARGLVSLLLVPIIINDEVIGALGADSVGHKHIFTEREMNLAAAMADQLSIALQNRRLIEETSRRAVLLQTSSDVGRVATSILDQDAMLDEAVELIKDRFGFYHAQIFLIDEAEQYAVLYKSTGEIGQKLLNVQHKLAIGSRSVIGQVTHQRKSIVIRSTDQADPESRHHRNEFLPDTQAELAIPLQAGGALIGVLDVQSTFPDAFTDEEISTLETLTTQLAIAIQNARAFKEQQETADRLKEIDKLKTQFLANMSHELRTPLNSIIGFSRVILKGIDGPLTELQKADLTSIHNSGQHLLGLINNILDLSKIEAGKMELNFEDTEVEPIIKTVMSTALALVKDKKVALQQDIPADLPTIWADPTRVRQVVLNLVSNACKFTDEGTVTTQVRIDGRQVVFSVSDTGIGIPEDQLGQIFEEFTQVDASTTRKVGGTGLGLPISRHFVEMHHGEIWVESASGFGTTVSFYIPIKSAELEEPIFLPDSVAYERPNQGNKKLIVAVDNDPNVIALYKRFLEKQNYEVVGLNHHKNIVSQIKEYDPFGILLDVIIPEQDGWGIIKALKDDPVTKDIPVVICSIASDKNRGFSLGAANYLIKPIVEHELVEALGQLDNPQNEEIKVLVVDDQADDILLMRRMLEAHGNYSIFEAENGLQGLELAKNTTLDLIILDLNMPEMNGFAMVEALKADENMRTIPIIIVSAQELTPEEDQRLTGQVEVLLHKGIFTENELLEDVSQALKRIRREEKSVI